MQQSHTGRGIDLAAVAKSCGFAQAEQLHTIEEVNELCNTLQEPAKGPRLFVLKIEAKNLPRSLPPRDATYIKTRFRKYLGLEPC